LTLIFHSTLLPSIWNWKDGSNEGNFLDARTLASESWNLDHVSSSQLVWNMLALLNWKSIALSEEHA